MKLKLHHVNLSTSHVAKMDDFYHRVLGLSPETTGLPTLEKKQGYAGDVAFLTDGHIQMHLAQRDVLAAINAGQPINPVDKGHLAFRTDDIEACKAELTTAGVPFADWGHQAVAGWHQIFFYDPDGNVIEIHQVIDD